MNTVGELNYKHASLNSQTAPDSASCWHSIVFACGAPSFSVMFAPWGLDLVKNPLGLIEVGVCVCYMGSDLSAPRG